MNMWQLFAQETWQKNDMLIFGGGWNFCGLDCFIVQCLDGIA